MRQSSPDQVPAVAPVPPIAPRPVDQEVVSLEQLNNPLHQLDVLQDRAMKLELKVADLSAKAIQIREERDGLKGQDREIAQQRYLQAQHDFTAANIELTSLQKKISQLERMVIPTSSPITLAAPPLPSGDLNSEQIMQLAGGAGMLLIPLVLAVTWRILRRGRKTETVDVGSNPQLQRMEQAIEAIALEVERIGEAQRFSTKLLSERQPDAIGNRAAVPAPPRVVTPH